MSEEKVAPPQTHTPGPWTVNGRTQGDFWRIDGCGEGAKVGMEFLMNPVALVKTREDAHLIASAPTLEAVNKELLEALEALPLESFGDDMGAHDAAEFVDHAGEFFKAMGLAKAAIAKARGRQL